MRQQPFLRDIADTPRPIRGKSRGAMFVVASVLALYAGSVAAEAAQSSDNAVETVVVTAQKREEAANNVPMSISVLSGDLLAQQGVLRTSDLALVVPGFTYTTSQVGTPIYTLRGVGFVDISMGGRPTVSVYADQVPIPFTIETLGANLDLERIEVLKGPQGTLFGQNATGGAINLIAAKPTDTFKAGFDVGYGNFNAMTIGGFLSGPIDDTLTARIAVQHVQNDGWQKSFTNGGSNGVGDLTSGRLLLDWNPISRLKIELNLNGYIDRSDSPASQLITVLGLPASGVLVPALATYPTPPRNNRAADWNPGASYRRDNRFFQANLRADYDLPGNLTLTSLTSYSNYNENQPVDIDGTTLSILQQRTLGSITSYYQELRVAGTFLDRGYFIVGANYASDSVKETNYDNVSGGTEAFIFTALGLPLFTNFRDSDNQDSHSYAAFANLDYDITDTLKAYGGLRYTRAIDHFNGCSSDTGDGNAASIFGPFENYVRGLLGLSPNPPIPPGGCVTANAEFVPQLTRSTLDEDNVSWRAGLEWKAFDQTMLYANASKGYKAGGYPDLGATATSQYSPARQESLVAYEAGFKSTLLDDTLQLNGAAFYYNYRDKQILGSVADPLFGRLLKLINVPKSRILGAELQATWSPVRGLTINANGSYIESKILGSFINYNSFGALEEFGGEPFPNTPKWQFTAGADYEWPLLGRWNGFAAIDVTHKSASNTELGEEPLLVTRAYTLVDLRAGIESDDGAWRGTVWVKNVGDTYYWTGADIDGDVAVRYTGMPRTFGVSLSYRFE